MENIFSREPINKTAKIVTSQKGCSLPELTQEQLRENLVKKVKYLSSELNKYPKKSKHRKALGSEILTLNTEINTIRPKKNAKGVEQFFIDAARDTLTKFQFNIVMDKACDRMRNEGLVGLRDGDG